MDTFGWIAIIVAVLVAAVVIWYLVQQARRVRCNVISGPSTIGRWRAPASRGLAESDLRERRERVSALDVRPLSRSDHDRFATEWTKVQAEFVDAPSPRRSRMPTS